MPLNPTIVKSTLGVLLLSSSIFAVAQAAPPMAAAPSTPTPVAALTQSRSLSMAALGRPLGISLSGVNKKAELSTGIRLDELVTRATLKLRAVYPPGMRHEQSFVRVYVNNQLAGMAQLKADKAGVAHWINIELDPLLFSDFAPIRIEYDGTYDTTCLMPENPTLRFDIAADSKLEIESRPLALVNDLALLPAPFFDKRDSNRLQVPVVLPSARTPSTLKAAGVLSSWLGAQAAYRQAAFELKQHIPDNRHSIVFSKGEVLPEGFSASDIKGPMLYMASQAGKPWIKQLYILGKTDEDLLTATYGLVLENQVLSGQSAEVLKAELGPNRKPYDAPRYTPTDRPVRFAELMDYPSQLEVAPGRNEVALNLRLPPDLFSWTGKNVDMALKYQYTAPSNWNDSLLNVEINQNLIQSFRLAPRQEQGQSRLTLNLLGAQELGSEESLKIPAFRVGGNNELKFSFSLNTEATSNCTGRPLESRGAIDPNSTLNFSDLPHYIKLPDLSAFANGGYPFSIYADLSETAIILPALPSPAEIQTYLNTMSLFGQWTGLPSNRVTVLTGFDAAQIKGKHWVALGSRDRLDWLAQTPLKLPLTLNAQERSMGDANVVGWMENLWSPWDKTSGGRGLLKADGPIGAMLGFESHLDSGKSALLITGSDEATFLKVGDSLLDYNKVSKIRGSVALFRADQLQSFRVGDTFISGSLPWWLKVRIAFSEYPALVALTGAGAGIVLAILLYGWLARRAGRRIQGD